MKKFMNLLMILVMISILSLESLGQWKPCYNGLDSEKVVVRTLITKDNNIFCATWFGGIFKSTNDGDNWIKKSIGLERVAQTAIYCIEKNENNIFIGTGNSIYLSTDNGESWTESKGEVTVHSILAINDTIIAGCNGIFYLSTNNGDTWIDKYEEKNLTINSLIKYNNKILAGTSKGLYISINNGESWEKDVLSPKYINIIVSNNNEVFLGTSFGLFHSTNNGESWTKKDSNWINSIAIKDSNIFIGTDTSGIYLSTNNGKLWIKKNYGFPNDLMRINSIVIKDSSIFTGTIPVDAWGIEDKDDYKNGIFKRNINEMLNEENEDPIKIELSSYNINFGEIKIGEDSTRQILIRNLSKYDLDDLKYRLSVDSAFIIKNQNQINIKRNDSTIINITFNPKGDFNYKDTIKFINKSIYGEQLCVLIGIGIPDDTTDIQDSQSSIDFKIYPNPASKELNISYNNISNYNPTIELIDVLGNVSKIISYELKTNELGKYHINIESLTEGLYYVRLTTKNDTITQKFIVLR